MGVNGHILSVPQQSTATLSKIASARPSVSYHHQGREQILAGLDKEFEEVDTHRED